MTALKVPDWFSTPKKVLFVTHPHIGDAVNLTAALRWMRKGWPEARLIGLTSKAAAPILVSCGHADEVWFRPEGLTEKLRFVATLRRSRFDLAVFAYPQRTLLNLARLGRVQRIVGVRERPDEKWDFAVPERSGSVKVPGEVADLLTALGCDCSDARPEIVPSAEDESLAEAALEGTPQHRVAVHTGASSAAKRWPRQLFGELVRTLSADGYSVVFIGGPGEDEVAASIAPPKSLNLAGKLTLLQTAAVLKRCPVLVSADSGPVHIAAAVGAPSVVLYGPTRAENHAPFGNRHVLIQGRCPTDCGGSCDSTCLRSISVGDVRAGVGQVLGEAL